MLIVNKLPILLILVSCIGCEGVLPTDPGSPELRACVDAAVINNKKCDGLLDLMESKGYSLPYDVLNYCYNSYNTDINTCKARYGF